MIKLEENWKPNVKISMDRFFSFKELFNVLLKIRKYVQTYMN